jgi:hypothetical protein
MLLATFAVVAPYDAMADSWTKIDDADGITIYRRDVPGSNVIAFKAEGLVRAPLVRVASVVLDTSRASEWIEGLAEAHIVRWISDREYVEYDHFKTPFVLKDRDFVTRSRLEYDPGRGALTIRVRSATDPAAPPTSYVRGELITSTFVLTPTSEGTWVSGDVHCDPRGSIPTWLVNFVQKDWPHDTLKRLRAQVAKPNNAEMRSIRKLVDQGPTGRCDPLTLLVGRVASGTCQPLSGDERLRC